ncbi:MAG: tetratricopeptide repeat protein [Oscillochloris sp.]|nr:tetratricopeptide repeat protein [Oscillochloris sp.]
MNGEEPQLSAQPIDTGGDQGVWLHSDVAQAQLIEAPFIGRDNELQQLLKSYYAVLETNAPRLITIVGDAGIGKSRLADEFRAWIGRLPEDAAIYALDADYHAHAQPYSTLRRLIVSLFKISPTHTPAQVRNRLERGIMRLLGRDQIAKVHVIGQLVGYDFSHSPHIRGILNDPQQIRDRAVYYAVQCLAALSARIPLVLLLDDFHEADDASLDLIARVCREGVGLRLMVVCLARQRLLERRPSWGTEQGAAMISLPALSAHHTRQLVNAILHQAVSIPAQLRRIVVRRSAGNPYFVEELLRMLLSDGVIEPRASGWLIHRHRLEQQQVPKSLDELLQARLQLISPAERGMLERAAVVGHTFWSGAILATYEQSLAVGAPLPPKPEDLLTKLTLRRLIITRSVSQLPGEVECSFEHELLHEVVYRHIHPARRRQYHRRIAEWLIERSAGQSDIFAGQIAAHLEPAGAAAEAGGWYLRAGQHALERHATINAAGLLRHALRLVPEHDQRRRIAVHLGLAECRLAEARFSDALEDFQHMAELAAQVGDSAAEARAWNGIAAVYDNRVEPRMALESAERAIALAERIGDSDALSTGLVRMAWATLRLDDPDRALELGQRALMIAEAGADPAGIARSKGAIGLAYEHRGDYERAAHAIADALRVCQAHSDLRQVSVHLNNLGYLANARGDYPTALQQLRENIRVCREIGNRIGEIYALSNLGTALNGLGLYEEAEGESRRGIGLCAITRAAVFSDFYRELALACLGQRRIDEALEAAQQALDLARRAESGREAGMAWRALGSVISQLDDSQGALACFAESVRLLEAAGAAGEHARTLRAWALHLRNNGSGSEAVLLWEASREAFRALGMQHELAQMMS